MRVNLNKEELNDILAALNYYADDRKEESRRAPCLSDTERKEASQISQRVLHLRQRLSMVIAQKEKAKPGESIRHRVARFTGTKASEWEYLNAPETGVGTEYFLRHKRNGKEVYVILEADGSIITTKT